MHDQLLRYLLSALQMHDQHLRCLLSALQMHDQHLLVENEEEEKNHPLGSGFKGMRAIFSTSNEA